MLPKQKLIFLLFISLVNSYLLAKDFVVGVIYPIQGPLSSGMCMIEAVINEARGDGLNITMLPLDSENSISGTITAAKAAVEASVDLVIGTRLSQESIVAAGILQSAQIPFIAPLSAHPDLDNTSPYMLRLVPDTQAYSTMLFEYIATNYQIKNMGIVRNLSLPFSENHTNKAIENLERLNKSINIKVFDIIDEYDQYAALINSMLAADVDALYLPLYIVQSAEILKELSSFNLDIPVFIHGGGSIIETDSNGEVSFGYFDEISRLSPEKDIIFHSAWKGNPTGRYQSDYLRLLSTYCGNYPVELASASAYDAIQLVIGVLRENDGISGIELLEKAKNSCFAGTVYPLVFDEYYEPYPELALHTIKNGIVNTQVLSKIGERSCD